MSENTRRKVSFQDSKSRSTTSTSSSSIGERRSNAGPISAIRQKTVALKTSQSTRNTSTRKALIRNCDVKTIEKPTVTKPHECKSALSNSRSRESDPYEVVETENKPNLSEPTQNTTLKTAQQIRRISDLDLEAAYRSLDELNLGSNNDGDLYRKVSKLALNVDSNERIYSNLVSIDVADDQLGPKITEVRKHRIRSKKDIEPHLEDYCRTDTHEDYWPSFSPVNIPFTPIDMYNGKALIRKKYHWKNETEKLLLFEKSDDKE